MRLHFYNELEHRQMLENYTLTEEQLHFTTDPLDALAMAQNDPYRYPLIATDEGEITNFLMLDGDQGRKLYSDNENAILLRAVSTDFYHQGKGYAKRVMQMLPDFVAEHFADKNEIVLVVNIFNAAAQGLYHAVGFVDEGVRTMGAKGEVIVMHYKLKQQVAI